MARKNKGKRKKVMSILDEGIFPGDEKMFEGLMDACDCGRMKCDICYDMDFKF